VRDNFEVAGTNDPEILETINSSSNLSPATKSPLTFSLKSFRKKVYILFTEKKKAVTRFEL
jgi:hypothetical protein